MDTNNETTKKAVLGLVAMGLFVIFILVMSGSTEGPGTDNEITTDTVENKVEEDFPTLSRARFDQLVMDVSELESIACTPENCTSVAYFNFSSSPSDLEMLVRSNAATFSKFKLDNTGTSHVTVFARVQGSTVFQCSAKKGSISECQ